MLFHCFTGNPPFMADDAVALMFQHCNEEVDSTSGWNALPPALRSIIKRWTAKQASERFTCVQEIEDQLRCITSHDGPARSIAKGSGTGDSKRFRSLSKSRPLVLLAAALALSISLGAFIMMQQKVLDSAPPEVAETTNWAMWDHEAPAIPRSRWRNWNQSFNVSPCKKIKIIPGFASAHLLVCRQLKLRAKWNVSVPWPSKAATRHRPRTARARRAATSIRAR